MCTSTPRFVSLFNNISTKAQTDYSTDSLKAMILQRYFYRQMILEHIVFSGTQQPSFPYNMLLKNWFSFKSVVSKSIFSLFVVNLNIQHTCKMPYHLLLRLHLKKRKMNNKKA